MNLTKIKKELRCTGWREYKRALLEAQSQNIYLEDEELVYAILKIPENYKISALASYTHSVKPISQASFDLVIRAIETSENDSYKAHLLREVNKIKIE